MKRGRLNRRPGGLTLRRKHRSHAGLTGLLQHLANVLFIHSWVPSAQNTVVPGGWSIGVEAASYPQAHTFNTALRAEFHF